MIQVDKIIQCLKEAQCFLQESVADKSMGVERFQVDNRHLQTGSAFIAIKGTQFDSHRVVSQIQNQVPLVIVDQPEIFAAVTSSCLLVRDSREAWAYLEALAAENPQKGLRFWAVTGTNGKTSSVWLGHALLRQLGIKVLAIGTIGIFLGDEFFPTQHTTPDPHELFQTLKKAKEAGCTEVLMEVSSHALVQKKLAPIRFEGSLFTSFSRDHLDFHPSMEDYFLQKLSLLTDYTKAAGRRVIENKVCFDCKRFNQELPPQTVIYGPKGTTSHKVYSITAENIKSSEFILQGCSQVSFWVPLFGGFIIQNLVGCLTLLEPLLPQKPEELQELLRNLKPIPGRLEGVCKEGSPYQVIVDYAHTPDALESCLTCLKPLVKNRLICIFGCGGDRDRGKRPLMGQVAATYADVCIVTSDNPRSENARSIIDDIIVGMKDTRELICEEDRKLAIRIGIDMLQPGDCVLIAGKGHENYQIIGTKKILFDDRELARQFIGNKSKTI